MNVNELEFILNSRNNKTSAGNDQIPMYLLRKIPLLMKKQVVILFNNMFNNAFIPINWKQAKFCAILKLSKKPSSYCRISSISNLSKLYEVFIQRYSINHPLTIFNSYVANNLNKKPGTIAVGIETEKAFDNTRQNGIIYKMKEKFKFPDHI
uniref:Reverse transcriptase domain-containing protein n=1 Tax=Megaselia scalaris TaxID=36166 RepID=T1GES9_MEGSC